MLVSLTKPNGEIINSKVEVQTGSIILHSRGGAFGKPNLRNPDYSDALHVILERLKSHALKISGVWLDSQSTDHIPADKKLLLRPDESDASVETLVYEIGKRGASFGRPAGAKGRGNTTKRIRIGVPCASAAKIAAVLLGNAKGPVGSKSREMPAIIYFNIGWMKEYAGPKADDPTVRRQNIWH